MRADRFGAPLRVLFLNDVSRNGGPGRTLYSLLKFMNPAKLHRLVIVPREGLVAQILREPGVAEEVRLEPGLIENLIEPWSRAIERGDFDAPLPVRALRALGNTGRVAVGMTRLARLVRRERVQAIFCNGTTANFAGAVLANLTGMPAIWHAFYTHLAPALRGLHRWLSASKDVRAILCVSQAVARLFDHCSEKVQIVYDSVDLAEFAPWNIHPVLRTELGWSGSDVVFGSQGRILPRKGYLEMVRAARMALDALATDEQARCRFAVLGDTPQDFARDHLVECRALVESLRLGRHFAFLGYRADVKPYAADFDVAVVPSVYQDPLPRAVLENMALCKPIIAFAVGGIAEAVEDGASGTLVPASDVDALARAFVRYFRHPELRRQHGERARCRSELLFGARAHSLSIQQRILHATGAADS
ncbi:MAG TPA: glycosyltransferase family 4 protein [Anaeromyxobacteraceae bacterium]|nr:glycosyltransferase family 4 protein [Anaeromyxobacteraceae bacterium]